MIRTCLLFASGALIDGINTGSLAWVERYPIQENGRGRLAIPDASQANITGDEVIV